MSKTYLILAPREMSLQRTKQLIYKYLARGEVILGIAKEEFVAGFEGQPQFRTLSIDIAQAVEEIADGFRVIEYQQQDGLRVIKNLNFDRAIIVNGSFHLAFNLRPEYQAILDKGAKVKYVSPFASEQEALEFAHRHTAEKPPLPRFSEQKMPGILKTESSRAFITDFQTAAAVVRDGQITALEHNAVVPYETYAWHYGLSREKHKCQPGDSSHYDTIHAETAALISAGKNAEGSAIYMRTFPCPHCARNIVFAGVKEVVYELEYGDKYSYELFNRSGIKYRRLQ